MHTDKGYKLLCIYKLDWESVTYKFHSLALAVNNRVENGLFCGLDYRGEFSEIKFDDFEYNDDVGIKIICPKINKVDFACIDIDFNPEKFKGEIVDRTIEILSKFKNISFKWKGLDNLYSLMFDSLLKEKVTYTDILNLYIDKLEKDGALLNMPRFNEIDKTMFGNVDKIVTKESRPSKPQLDSEASLEVMPDIDVNGIISDTKKKIIGQDEAIEAIVANIYVNQRIIATGNKDLISTQKASILLDGSTGTGKTAIIKEVADRLSLPIVIANSGNFSATGYRGDSLIDILSKLYQKANGDLELAQRGIVCFDEIDKLGGQSKDRELVMRRSVQQELLAFMSGTKFDVSIGKSVFDSQKVEFDTSNLTFIGMGAFTQIRDRKITENKEKKKQPIGFSVSLEENKASENTYVMTEQDYIDYGLERELVGRFPLLTSTKTYSVEDFKKILTESSISPLKSFIEFAKSFGVHEVTYNDDFIQLAAEMAYRDGFGARGLQKIISNLKNSMLLDIINRKTNNINLTVEMLKKSEEKNIRRY